MDATPADRPSWVRSGVLAGAAELLAELGVDADALAIDCAMDPAALSLPDLPVPGPAVVGFFEAAAQRGGCEDFGIRLASRQDLSVLGPLWMTMRSAQTVRDALQVLAQFFVVHTTGAIAGFEPQPDGSAIFTYALSAGVSPRDRQTIELGLTLLCHELRLHCGADWLPRAVLFAHDRPKNLASHRRAYGPRLHFAQERNAVWIDRVCLETALSGRSMPTHAMLRRLLVSRVDGAQAIAAKVEGTMRALMPFAPCDRAQVARVANLSQRTLQRRLAEAGTSFQDLRDRVRVDIALKYLRQSSLQAAQISEILGYSEPAAFTRAFRRRLGLTPSEARRGRLKSARAAGSSRSTSGSRGPGRASPSPCRRS
jgi:AraC-like DNA-binding protein